MPRHIRTPRRALAVALTGAAVIGLLASSAAITAAPALAQEAQDFVRTSGGSTITDTEAAVGSALTIEHKGQGTAGSDQTYGLNLYNLRGARSGVVVHQYSDVGPAVWVDNTGSAPGLRVNNTSNEVLNPGRTGTGDFLEVLSGGRRLSLTDGFTWRNEAADRTPLTADGLNGPGLVVKTSAVDRPALVVQGPPTGVVQEWRSATSTVLTVDGNSRLAGTGPAFLQLDSRARLGNAAASMVIGQEAVHFAAGRVGFYDRQPIAKPTITGSRSDGTALRNLLLALQRQGLILDETTP